MNNQPSKQTIRDLYEKSVTSKQHAQNLLQLLAKQEQNAFMMGYTGATKMLMAKHLFNPFNKLNHFNTGKKLLNKAIATDKSDIELIFLRYATQVSAPSILGYNDDIDTDKKALLKWLSEYHGNDEKLVDVIGSFMKQQNLTSAERQQILKKVK